MLKGGDKRSIGQVDQVIEEVLKKPAFSYFNRWYTFS